MYNSPLKEKNMNTIKFLGTAGARFVVAKQVRSSGGIWCQLGEIQFLVDPGPGSLVRCTSSRPKLDPRSLDGIILTHRHLDHAADINIMIEAMTEGGFRPKGVVFAPRDALEEDPVILRFLREKVDKIEILEESSEYSLGKIRFRTSPRLKHSVETYGLSFQTKETSISLLPDTAYFDGIENYFKADVMIIHVVLLHERPDIPQIQHLALENAKRIIQKSQPKIAILTHFGMTMVKAKPWELAEKISSELGIKILAARDGMLFNIDTLS